MQALWCASHLSISRAPTAIRWREKVSYRQSLTSERELPSPVERRRLGGSIWLLLLLLRWKRPRDIYIRSGDSIRGKELAAALGIGERQARRELQRLREAGYVELENTGRGYKNPSDRE